MKHQFSNKILLFCMLFCYSNFSFAQVNLSQGLVLYLPFNGNTLDASGQGNNATNNGATLSSDKWGNLNSAYYFNGTSNFMSITNNASLTPNSFTLCARVKPMGFYNGTCFNNIVIAKGNSAGNASGDIGLSYTPTLNQNPSNYCFIQDSTHENYRVYAGANGAANSLACINATNGIPYINTNVWDCVVAVFDSSSGVASMYVNGIFRYSYTNSNLLGTSTNTIYLGKQNYPGYEYWMNAVLDEVRIYNRPLNLAEVDSVCNLTSIINDSVQANFGKTYPNSCDSTIVNFIDYSLAFNSNISNWHWDFGDGNTSILQNPQHNYLNGGLYNVTLITTNNNSKSDTVVKQIIALASNLNANAGANLNVCFGNSILLNGSATGGNTYQWLPNASLNNSTILSPLASPAATTTYSLIVTNSIGCHDTDDITVFVNVLPIVSAGADTSYCDNTNGVQLNGSGIGSASWSPTINLSNPNILNPIATPSSITNYTLTVTNSNNCSASDVVQVSKRISPAITVSPNVTICNGDSTVLIASGTNNYSWTPIINSITTGNQNIVFPNINTTYTVIGTATNSCTDTASVLVSLSPSINLSILGDSILCIGDTVMIYANGATSYQWSPTNLIITQIANGITTAPTNSAVYTVNAVDNNNCKLSKTVNVFVDQIPNLQISKSNDIQCAQNSAQLNINGAINYTWVPTATLNNSNIPNPIAFPYTTTSYTVFANSVACVNVDSITVVVYNNNAEKTNIPTAFSPNSDGLNDCFIPISNAKFINYSLKIFNRWGEMVYATLNPNDCWDGQQKNGQIEIGVYFYILTAQTDCSSIERKGEITLIR